MINKRAGQIEIRAFLDGYPASVRIYIDGDEVPNTLGLDDLRDLVYAATETLADATHQGRRT